MRNFSCLAYLIILFSCNSVGTGSFWLNFNDSSIKSQFLDHGPWGGTTIISWKFETDQIDEYQIREFAEMNEWFFITTSKEFKFPHGDNLPKEIEKCIQNDFLILTFKTDWILVEPGSGDTFDALGYVFINPNGKEMTVYHVWGE
jgi:hypothetical protein